MKMMRWTLLATLFAAPALGFGSDETWESGWGMGVSEAVIEKGPGNRIYIACGTPSPGRPVTSIHFMLGGKDPQGDKVLLTFDGEAPQAYDLRDGQIQSWTHVGASQFEHALERFKTHERVNVAYENGTNATFTLNGAAEAIGPCPSDFSQ